MEYSTHSEGDAFIMLYTNTEQKKPLRGWDADFTLTAHALRLRATAMPWVIHPSGPFGEDLTALALEVICPERFLW